MDFNRERQSATLQGPDEIRPVLRAIGDPYGGSRVFGPEDTVEIAAEDAMLAATRLFDRSWLPTISKEEGQRMRDLSDNLGAMIISQGDSLTRQPLVDAAEIVFLD